MTRLPRRLPLLALVITLAACGGTSTPRGGSATIGTPGGQVAAESGAAVSVPPGALDDRTLVKVAAITAAPPDGVGAVSPLYQIEPDGLVLASPATVTLPLPAGATSGSVFWERADKSGYDALGGRIDPVAGTITVDVPRFGRGVVGEHRTTRLVTGTAMTTYISATSRVSLPTPSATPPQALVPDGSGGFTVLQGTMGTGRAAGTFLIPDVPEGEYLLKYGDAYLVTDSCAPNLSTREGGRPPDDLVPVTETTTLELSLTNLAPWQDGDQLEFFSTEANDWDFQSDQVWATPLLQSGDTTATLVMDLSLLTMAPTSQIRGTSGHHAYAAQMASATSTEGVSYQAMKRLASLGSFDTADGSTTQVSAAMVDYAQANTAAFDIRFRQWQEAFASDAGSATLAYSGGSGFLGVLAQPGQAEDGFYSANADLLLLSAPDGSDLLTGTMSYGSPEDSPFGGHWGVLGDVSWRGLTPQQVPGTTAAAYAATGIEWVTSLAALQDGPLVPPLTLPRSATVADLPFFVGGTGMGLTPTVAWSAPATGTAEQYVVTVLELYANPDNFTWARLPPGLSSFTTPHTSMTVPAGVLEAGRTYVFRIAAVGRMPGVHGLNRATATIASALFTP